MIINSRTLFDNWRVSFSRALIVTRREIRDSLRDWRIVTPIVTLTVVLPVLIIFGLKAGSGFIDRLGPEALNTKILPFAIIAVGFFPMSFSLVIALESFVGEKERNSLEALLTAPLTDRELFTGKYLAAVIPPVATSSFGMFIFVGLIILTGGTMPVSFELLLVFWLLTVSQAMVMVAGAVIVSSHTTSVRAANLLASFIILPMSLVVQLEAVILLTGQRIAMIFILMAMFIVLIILLRTGITIFNREEIIAREGDNFTLKGIIHNLRNTFIRTPRETLTGYPGEPSKFSFIRLYRRDIPQILFINRRSILAVCLCLVAAILVGWFLSGWDSVRDILQSRSTETPAEGYNTISVCKGGVELTWSGIFANNLRSILLGSFASLLTLGVGGILLLMVSVGPIGLLGGAFVQLKLNPLPLLFGFVLPHGIIELPAVVIAIAAGLQMGSAYLAPSRGLTVGGSLQLAIINYIKLLALVVPLLLLAAIIEANVTPAFGCWLTNGKF